MAHLDSDDLSQSTDCTDGYNVLGGYVPSLVQHLGDTRARLGIGVTPQDNKDLIDAGGAVGGATDVLASSWTPTEHDAFFRALSVYSRWRPDLIAACVPTKTEWEVWMYLEALEDGAATLAAQRDGEDMDVEEDCGDEVDAPSSDSDAGADEVVCEPALEVSQAWIEAEEHMASWIVQREHPASVGVGGTDAGVEDVDEVPRRRKRGRPRGARKGRARSRARTQATAHENRQSPSRADRSPSSERSLMSTWQISREPSGFSERKRETLMSRLGVPHLLVLDSILREGEGVGEDKGKSREGSVVGATLTERGDEEHDVDVSGPSDRIITPPGASNVSSNMAIDPALLALSGGAEHPPSQDTLAPTRVSAQGPSPPLEVFLQPGATTVFTFPPGDATHTLPNLAANAQPDLSLFSPRSRRRVQKRLYMRRKRAMARDDGQGIMDTGIEKLRPGKKTKLEAPEASTSAACTEAPLEAEGEATEHIRKKSKGGLTLPYKLKAQFAELGIDAAYLCSQGMDMLNLGALGRLCSSLEHGGEEEDESVIDAQLVQHLQAAVVSFVTDIMHRAIVWRERETKLKQRSQAWRHGNRVTLAAIEHAVATTDARCHSHKTALSEDGGDSEAADLCSGVPRLSPHRDVYAPLIRPPSGWQMNALGCLARTYELEATRRRCGASVAMDAELMPDETDDEALAAELEDEAGVDAADVARGGALEMSLWEGVRILI